MACRGCGRRIVEYGSNVYMGKLAILHNGQQITITACDKENPRRFAGKLNEELVWFSLSDIRALKG